MIKGNFKGDQAISTQVIPDGEAVITASFGPAMLALTDKQRAFVLALTMSPDENLTQCAATAGYEGDRDTLGVTGSRLKNNPRIQAAIHEEADRRLHGAKLLATRVLVDIAGNKDETSAQRLKAVGMILDRVGMAATTEQHIVIEHRRSESELIQDITALAKKVGMDPQKVLGSVGVVIDADFVEVKAPAELEAIW